MRYPLLATTSLLFAYSQLSYSQFVETPTDWIQKTGYAGIDVRYKEVPAGICEIDPDVKSFSGYADVADNEHIFFWFFEARNEDPSSAPLTVWINGGPGSTSMIGLFQENGPCRIDENGTTVDNPYSWSNVSNMIFIDQPVTTGFSYSEAIPAYLDPATEHIIQLPDTTCPDYAQAYGTCGTYSYGNTSLTANTTANAAPNFWKTLQGFMGAFPQYSRHGFHFSTESYGGHYGPIFNTYIETQNELIRSGDLPEAHEISLETVLIGNGWYDPLIQYAAFYNFTVYPGNTYDYFPYNASIENQLYNAMYGAGNCYDQTLDCNIRGIDEVCSTADKFCAYQVESVLDNIANRDEYDIRQLQPDPLPPKFYIDYLNTPKVQSAIGAYVNFSTHSPTVGSAFGSTGDDNRIDGTIDAMRDLVADNLTVVMYFGDADYNCNWLGGEVIAEEIDVLGFSAAGYTNITTSDGIVHGQVKQAGAFSFVRIYEAGHEVPFYQPLVSLEMFERAIHGSDIATGLFAVPPGSDFVTSGTKESTYREGNSTVHFKTPKSDSHSDVSDSIAQANTNTAAMVEQATKYQKVFKPWRRGL